MQKVLYPILALALFSSSALANSVPTRTRSSYGSALSPIEASSTGTIDGLSVTTDEFCQDATIDSQGAGTCQVGFAFQINSPLPASATSLAITLPVPAGATIDTGFGGAGILTNDSTGFNIPFSPFSASDVSGLPNSAIVFGTDGSGNPTFNFALPLALNGGGNGLALFLDITAPNNNGFYCYTSATCPKNLPNLPVPEIQLSNTTTTPEPASMSLLFAGLVGLAGLSLLRKRVA